MLSILRECDAPEPFRLWRQEPGLAAIDAHPFYGAFGRRYYPAVYGDERVDESFAVIEGGQALALVACARGKTTLDYYGMPIRFFPREGLATELSAVCKAAFEHIAALAQRYEAGQIILRDDASIGTLSKWGEQALNRGFIAEIRFSAVADLGEGERGLRRGLRKSFRSLLNWGQQNLSVICVNRANPDRASFCRYQEFHRKIAGRSTRPQASWDAMYDWVAAGGGEILLASLDNAQLVAATMVLDGASVAYYGSGVYDRDHFDKPLTHWPLWLGMLHSAERGMTVFDLGEVPPAGSASAKEVNIGYFKRGFASRIASWLVWEWRRARQGGVEPEPSEA